MSLFIKCLRVFCIILIFLHLVGCMVFARFEQNDKYFFWDGAVNREIINQLMASMFLCLNVLLFTLKIKKRLKIAGTVLCLILALFSRTNGTPLFDPSREYFYFTSPDNKELIVEEVSFLLGGHSNAYIWAGSYLVKEIPCNISTDDGYCPFSHNDYSIEWEGNSAIIVYGFRDLHKTYRSDTIALP